MLQVIIFKIQFKIKFQKQTLILINIYDSKYPIYLTPLTAIFTVVWVAENKIYLNLLYIQCACFKFKTCSWQSEWRWRSLLISWICHSLKILELKVSKSLCFWKRQNTVIIKTGFYVTYQDRLNSCRGIPSIGNKISYISFKLAVLRSDMPNHITFGFTTHRCIHTWCKEEEAGWFWSTCWKCLTPGSAADDSDCIRHW